MLQNLISAEKINKAYEEQIKALNLVAGMEEELNQAKYNLELAISEMSRIEGFKLGGNDMARNAQIEEHCHEENQYVKRAEARLDRANNEYKIAGLEVQKLITLIRYMEAVKDLPENLE